MREKEVEDAVAEDPAAASVLSSAEERYSKQRRGVPSAADSVRSTEQKSKSSPQKSKTSPREDTSNKQNAFAINEREVRAIMAALNRLYDHRQGQKTSSGNTHDLQTVAAAHAHRRSHN